MRSSSEVTALIFAENRQGLVDIGHLFSSPLPRRPLVKKFYTAKNLVAVIGFSHVILIYFSMAGTASDVVQVNVMFVKKLMIWNIVFHGLPNFALY
jgi:hypothetical protein